MPEHAYGYIHDHYDPRDYLFALHPVMAAAPKVLPPSTGNRQRWVMPIRDQGQLGSCTGFGTTSALTITEQNAGKPQVLLSALMQYFDERVLEGSVNQDAGAQIRDGIKCLAQQGVATEAQWPYDISRYTMPPPPAVVAEAAAHKAAAYHRVTGVRQAKVALAAGMPVIIGFTVYASFEGNWAVPGHMPMPARGEQILGGHCVHIEDYVDDPAVPGGGYFVVANQWGTGWQANGWFFMPYAYWTPRRVSDCWVITA